MPLQTVELASVEVLIVRRAEGSSVVGWLQIPADLVPGTTRGVQPAARAVADNVAICRVEEAACDNTPLTGQGKDP
jgi:hypothetical protein